MKLKIGLDIYHIGASEPEGKVFPATITGFDGIAIKVESPSGSRYLINSWELCDKDGKMLRK